MLDQVIRSARIVDGTGAPERTGDVGIRDGRIVAIGKVNDAAHQTLEVAPEGEVLGRAIAYAQAHAHQRGDVLGQIKANRHHEVAAALQAESDKR